MAKVKKRKLIDRAKEDFRDLLADIDDIRIAPIGSLPPDSIAVQMCEYWTHNNYKCPPPSVTVFFKRNGVEVNYQANLCVDCLAALMVAQKEMRDERKISTTP